MRKRLRALFFCEPDPTGELHLMKYVANETTIGEPTLSIPFRDSGLRECYERASLIVRSGKVHGLQPVGSNNMREYSVPAMPSAREFHPVSLDHVTGTASCVCQEFEANNRKVCPHALAAANTGACLDILLLAVNADRRKQCITFPRPADGGLKPSERVSTRNNK